jgi:Flp pilus assembly protein TadG
MNSVRETIGRLVREQRGQSLTEFALVAPLLLVIVFAMIDFGKAINYWNNETQLAAQGARIAAINGSNSYSGACFSPDPSNPRPSATTLTGYIQCQADTQELYNGAASGQPGASPVAATICFPNGSGSVGQPVRVKVTTNYNWLPILEGTSIGFFKLPNLTTTTLTGVATMRLEQAWTGTVTPC